MPELIIEFFLKTPISQQSIRITGGFRLNRFKITGIRAISSSLFLYFSKISMAHVIRSRNLILMRLQHMTVEYAFTLTLCTVVTMTYA